MYDLTMVLGTDKHCVIRLSLLTLLVPFLSLEGVQAHAVGTRKWGGYRRFHANSSLVGQPVPCTSDEKICFRYNLMFYPKLEKCLPIGRSVTVNCDLTANNQEFEHGSGHIFASCPEYEDPCPGYRMAYDNRCYPQPMVHSIICHCSTQPILNFLRGLECQCIPKTPVVVEQPAEHGHCTIPDFNFPDTERSFFFHDALGAEEILRKDLGCSTEQFACFSDGKVWVTETEGCFRLLERGPCAEDHLVALDSRAAAEQRAVAICVHKVGGCPHGQIRMAFDGQCHDERHMDITAPGVLFRNVFGHFGVIKYNKTLNFYPKANESKQNICVVEFDPAFTYISPEESLKPVCGSNDKSHCSLYDLESEPPTREEDE